MTSQGSSEGTGTRAASLQMPRLLTVLKACVGMLVLAVLGHFPRNLRGSGRGLRGPPRPPVAHSSGFMILISVLRGTWATGSRAHGRQATPTFLTFGGHFGGELHAGGRVLAALVVREESAQPHEPCFYTVYKSTTKWRARAGPLRHAAGAPRGDTPADASATCSWHKPKPKSQHAAGMLRGSLILSSKEVFLVPGARCMADAGEPIVQPPGRHAR